MVERRNRLQAAVLAVMSVAALAACSTAPAAPGGGQATATTGPGATATLGQSTAPAATAGPTLPVATAAANNLPTVDLVLSGAYSVVAKGTKGQCNPGKDASGKVTKFQFSAVEADYPGLGQGLYVSEGNNGYVTTKWLVDGTNGFLNSTDQMGVSPDHHSIVIDIPLGPTEHLKGTITCP